MPTTNQSPSLYTRAKNPAGAWRYHRVKEGRGQKTGEFQGPFFARPCLNGKQVWKTLYATTFKEAKEEVGQLALALEAESKGLTVVELDALTNGNRIPIRAAIDTYLDQKSGKAKKTVAQYRLTLHEFMDAIKVRFMDEITEGVLRSYKKLMESQSYAGKTIDTRLNIIFFLLKKNGIAARLPRDEMPTIEEEAAVPYADGELKTLLDAMDETEVVSGKEYSGVGFGAKVRYKFFLGTACREQEVAFAAWSDIDFDKKTYTVRRKDDVGFTPKSHESRTVPLPDSLMTLLKARKKVMPHSRWVFTNTQGGPEGHYLHKLKSIALHAGLNCGECHTTKTVGTYDNKRVIEVSCKDNPVCEHFYLHRFRKTCATRWEQNAVPVRTIQHYLGHKNLETTMKYLGIADSETLRGNINRAFGD